MTTTRCSPERSSFKDRCARGIADAHLKLPLHRPFLNLFILAGFEQDMVFALLQSDR